MNNMDITSFTYSEATLSETASLDTSRSRAWIEISLDALRHNVRYLQSLLPTRCALMPVVKANAYGHGAGLIAGELNALGIRSFCVACVSEGVELRRRHIAGEILVLGYTHTHRRGYRYAPPGRACGTCGTDPGNLIPARPAGHRHVQPPGRRGRNRCRLPEFYKKSDRHFLPTGCTVEELSG